MASLFGYLKATQRFLREQQQSFLNIDSLTDYINRGRKEVAMRCQAIRVLTPISGAVTAWTVTNPGSGYSNSPTFAVSPPDFPSGILPNPNGAQATAAGIVQSGQILAIDSVYGGSGYFQPTLTITDTTGKGASATPVLSYINQINQGQEVYKFSDINLAANPGCDAVYFVRSVALLYNNFRYVLPCYAFSVYQALLRNYPFNFQGPPEFSSQFGQGTGGSFYVYPIPSQQMQAEWDCLVTPSDLIDDQSYEALPDPWTDAVSYYAAHLAMIELQNYNASGFFHTLFEKKALSVSNYARAGRTVNPYGRY